MNVALGSPLSGLFAGALGKVPQWGTSMAGAAKPSMRPHWPGLGHVAPAPGV